jgi:probable rRNA maturation factor
MAQVRRWVRAALDAAGAPARVSLTVRFVDEAESAGLNAAHRGRRGPTNVLAFPAGAPAGLPRHLAQPLGDVVVCVPLARAEAARHGKTDTARLAHLVVHGVLHLLGHDHHRRAQRVCMEALERTVLYRLGLPDPYRAGVPVAAP